MNSEKSVGNEVAFQTLAALFLTSVSATISEHEADGAFRALRRKLVGTGIDAHAVADRIRGCGSFAPRTEDPPVFTAMPPGVRRMWLDAIALRLRLNDWERRFLRDIRAAAVSSLQRMSMAQTRTVQQLVDRAWHRGVRP